MQPVVRELERLLGAPVTFLADPTSEEAVTATRRLPRGGVAVGENTRFYPGEEKNDPELARRFAALGDFYVNDAFGSAHRAHASTEAVAHLLKPAVAGFLMQQELRYLGEALHQPRRPFVAVLGGAKISGKIDLIEASCPRWTPCSWVVRWRAPSSRRWGSKPAPRWWRPTGWSWRASS